MRRLFGSLVIVVALVSAACGTRVAPTKEVAEARDAAPAPPADPVTSPAGKRPPALFATIGTLSGPAGTVLQPFVQAEQVWVADINARGGLNGHEVRLLVHDDGGDPARHRALLKEAAEAKKVLAILGYLAPIHGGAPDYLSAQRVPVIGHEGGWYDSPMVFPQASSGDQYAMATIAATAHQALPVGHKKLATIVCAEVQGCGYLEKVAAAHAPKLGFSLVYRGKAGLAQPDYTAECLAAQNAGADVVLVLLDTNSLVRLSGSCARQTTSRSTPRSPVSSPTA